MEKKVLYFLHDNVFIGQKEKIKKSKWRRPRLEMSINLEIHFCFVSYQVFHTKIDWLNLDKIFNDDNNGDRKRNCVWCVRANFYNNKKNLVRNSRIWFIIVMIQSRGFCCCGHFDIFFFCFPKSVVVIFWLHTKPNNTNSTQTQNADIIKVHQ